MKPILGVIFVSLVSFYSTKMRENLEGTEAGKYESTSSVKSLVSAGLSLDLNQTITRHINIIFEVRLDEPSAD